MPDAGATRLAVPAHADDHVLGPADAPATLVEFGDFECPDSARASTVLRDVRRRLGDQVKVIFRHFPLRRKHPHAQWAAEAAEAAGAQGRFWEMHDALFVHLRLLGDEHLGLYVSRLGLDATRLRRDIDTHVYAPRVQVDYEGGERSGVTGTPSIFINGVRYDGPIDVEPLAATLAAVAPR